MGSTHLWYDSCFTVFKSEKSDLYIWINSETWHSAKAPWTSLAGETNNHHKTLFGRMAQGREHLQAQVVYSDRSPEPPVTNYVMSFLVLFCKIGIIIVSNSRSHCEDKISFLKHFVNQKCSTHISYSDNNNRLLDEWLIIVTPPPKRLHKVY